MNFFQILLPMNCPATASAMKSGIQIAGVSSQILKGIIKGMDASIISHHLNVNFLYFTRHLPKRILTVKAITDTVKIFMAQNYKHFWYLSAKQRTKLMINQIF